jgi:fatty-acyl-CoA synthase
MPNMAEAVFAVLACARLGAVHSVVFGGFASHNLALRIDDAKPVLLICADAGMRAGKVIPYKLLVDEALRAAKSPPPHVLIVSRGLDPGLQYVAGRDLDYAKLRGPHEQAEVPVVWLESNEPSYLLYTSGTTGKPKGCMHTHSSVQATTVVYLQWRGSGDGAVVLSPLPMFHVTGMQAGMNGPLCKGATLVIMSRWDRDCAARLIERQRVTNWSAITTMLVDFLSNPDLDKYDLSSLQVLGGGGAAMPEALARKLEEVFGLPYVEGYGLSETMAPTHINPPQRPKRQCGGIPIFNTDARVIDIEKSVELKANEVGEIIVSGPQIFQGYWKQPEATAEVFIQHDGKRFFRTGDLGYYDEDGYFFITDRLKRMINASGFKVWPAEVEALLYGHPAIQEACVVGAPDGYRGETVKALVVLKKNANATPGDITGWARDKMAAYKVPRVIEFVEHLPKTPTGKILWRELQEKERRK